MVMTASPSLSGHAREFYTQYSNHGGERYHAAFSDDQAAFLRCAARLSNRPYMIDDYFGFRVVRTVR